MTSEALLAQASWVRRLAASLVASDEAEDFAQETLRSALAQPPLVSSTANLRAWLRSVMRNLVHVDRRGRSLRAWHEEHAAKREAIESDAGDRTELQERLARAVHALAEPYRSAIVLRYFDELAPREIAERQSISYDAARQRLSRGLSMLRAQLDRDYDGGRDAWSAVCIAVVKKSSLASTSTALATGGAIVMGKTLGMAAALALVVAASFWWMQRAGENVRPESLAKNEANAVVDAAAVADSAPAAPKSSARTEERAPVEPLAADPKSVHHAIDRDRDLHGVVLAPDGKPLKGAGLRVWRHEFAETELLDLPAREERMSIASSTSDENGEFAIALEPARAFELDVSAHGFATQSIGHCHAGERVVVRLDRGALVFGRVVRKSDGSPVAGASVDLPRRANAGLPDSSAKLTTVTDGDGHFRFEGLASGDYTLMAYPQKDSDSEWVRLKVASGETIERNLEVAAGFRLKGRVLDAESGQPIAGAEISEGWTFRRTVRSNFDGEFDFEGFAETGYYEVSVRAAGYGRLDQSVRAPDEPMPEAIELRMRRAQRIHGRIVDGAGQPISNAYVAAVAYEMTGSADQLDWLGARSGTDGEFRFDSVRSDVPHVLYVKRDGFGTVAYNLAKRQEGELVLELGDIALASGATVRGSVVDDSDRPIANQTVQLAGWNADYRRWNPVGSREAWIYLSQRSTRTDDLGRFAFADVAPGDYRVQAVLEESRGKPQGVALAVKDGVEPAPARIVMSTGLAIQGRVVDASGAPVRAYVNVDPIDRNLKTAGDVQSEPDGSFAVHGLARGSYTVLVQPISLWDDDASHAHHARTMLTPVEAGTLDVRIVVPRAERIAGRVVDAKGDAVARAVVYAKHGDGDRDALQGRSDSSGHFTLWVAAGDILNIEAVPSTSNGGVRVVTAGTDVTAAVLRDVSPGGAEIELRLP